MINEDECMVVHHYRGGNNYSIVMLHGITYRSIDDKLIATKESLINIVKNPIIVTEKEKALMFKIGIVNEETLETQNPIYKHTRLLIDYDNEEGDSKLIEKFVEKFKDYSFILFTTFSSVKYKPRFKVILKLKYMVDNRKFKDKLFIHRLGHLFTIDKCKPDVSCFESSHFQFMPCKKKDGYYEYRINKGIGYDLGEDLYDYVKPNMLDLMIKHNLKINTIKTNEERRQEVKDRFEQAAAGLRKEYMEKVIKKSKIVRKKDIECIIRNETFNHRYNFIFRIAPFIANRMFNTREAEQLCLDVLKRPLEEKHIIKLGKFVEYLRSKDMYKEH